ncbi:MAG: sulfide/dihydroorotate dehydrogenase-like FAD/NAD-binding protein [Clostridia bacterium]
MYEIVKRDDLTKGIVRISVSAERIAKKCRPGQFVMIRVSNNGERIPLTIYDYDKELGVIELVYQIVGVTTKKLSLLNVGDKIMDLLGPLGTPASKIISNNILAIAGGLGIVPLLSQIREYEKEKITAIYGASNMDSLVLKEELENYANATYYYTEDGSFGKKGFVTKDLEEMLKNNNFEQVLAIGPIPMMEAVVKITREFNIPTRVSLNPIMVDGTGMCGGCRVRVGTETKLACVDGPEFNGLFVDFDQLKNRVQMYEKRGHDCAIKK